MSGTPAQGQKSKAWRLQRIGRMLAAGVSVTMSIFYATLNDIGDARALADELLRGGVRPESIGVVSRQSFVGDSFSSEMTETYGSVGDATSFVGRADDPERNEFFTVSDHLGRELTASTQGPLMGISTSDRAIDVESVDQTDDSQALSEDMAYPRESISQSTHEVDDIALTMRTGLPTIVPVMDDVRDSEGPRQDQNTSALETISIPGAGTIMGEGQLATVGLDAIMPGSDRTLVEFLQSEGMPANKAREFSDALESNKVIFAVELVPGTVAVQFIEQAAQRHGVQNAGVYDVPRFVDQTRASQNRGMVM